MKYFIAPLFLLPISLFLSGCMSFDPVPDSDKAIILSLPLHEATGSQPEITEIQVVGFPSHLNRPTPVVMQQDGSLQSIEGYYWAEPLGNSIANELTIALVSLKNIPPEGFLRVRFYRFAVLYDGSAHAVLEWTIASKEKGVLRSGSENIDLTNAWDPQNPSSFIKGYTALLSASAKAIRRSVESESSPD